MQKEIDIKKTLNQDLRYIKNDIIAMQLDKNKCCEEDEVDKYVKFSRILKTVTVINLTKKQYKNYWNTQYKDYPLELNLIMQEIEEKFKNGLTSREDMIQLIENSDDYESEKRNALKVLKEKEKKAE